jgi:tetratricopeptide (TPR) repeat protein
MLSQDDEDDGRIRSDAEVMRALEGRDDIFFIDRGGPWRAACAIALVVCAACGIWLTTALPTRVAPDRILLNARERTAKLLNAPAQPSIAPETAEKMPAAGTASPRERGYVTMPGALSAMNIRHERTTVGSPAASSTGTPMQAPVPAAPEPAGRATDAGTPSAATVIHPATGTESHDTGGSPGGAGTGSGIDWKSGDSAAIVAGYADTRQGNYAPAFAAFRQVLRHNPRDTLALSGTGTLFLYSGLLDSATAFYNAALAVNPRMVAAHKGLGTTRYYISTLAANPRYAARQRIADPVRYINAQYDSAIAEYSAAIAIDSTYVSALTDRGVIRDLRKDYDGAIRDYSRAIAIDPSFADAYSKRAMTYRTLGRYKEALADYTRAIRLGTASYEYDPMLFFANVYFGRGVVYHKMGELGKAIADFDTTLTLSPRHSLAMLNKAMALSDAQRYDSAITAFTTAIAWLGRGEYDGAQYRAYLNRGDAFMALRNYDAAAADFKNALEFPPLAATACWRVAECCALRSERDSAMIWLKKSISSGFHGVDAWSHDPNLAFIRHDREFRELMERAR